MHMLNSINLKVNTAYTAPVYRETIPNVAGRQVFHFQMYCGIGKHSTENGTDFGE